MEKTRETGVREDVLFNGKMEVLKMGES